LIKSFITLAQGGKHKYHSNLLQYFDPRISSVKITVVIYRGNVFFNFDFRPSQHHQHGHRGPNWGQPLRVRPLANTSQQPDRTRPGDNPTKLFF
jgi:hypothetical protein